MKKTLLLLPVLLLLSTSNLHAQTFLAANLTPAEESHDVTSGARGTAAMVLTPEGLQFYVSVDGLSGPITAAHFHSGATGSNGGPVRTLTNDFSGNSASGIWTAADPEPLTDELVRSLLTGNLYINVHTGAYGAGEVRGQVRTISGTALTAILSPEQELNDVTSDGVGTAYVLLTEAGAIFAVTVSDLTGPITNAHFHQGADGTNGGPVRTITGDFSGNTAIGVWTESDAEPLTDDAIEAMLLDELYVNVHTATYGPGEIRGQLRLAGGWGLSATLDANQEVHNVASDAKGSASVVLTEAGAVFNVTVSGLTGPITAAHFHSGAVGTNGGPVRTITGDFVGNTASGLWRASDAEPLTDELIQSLLGDELYINVHTGAYGAGEIRGQVTLNAGGTLRANLTPAQETHDVTSDGSGTAVLSFTETGIAFSVTVDELSGPITAAHIHGGVAGVNGGPVRTITSEFSGNTATGIWTPSDPEALTSELVEALIAGGLYVNVHTGAYGAGEIRGQISVNSGTTLRANLTPEQETHDVTSDARGTAHVVLTTAGAQFSVTVDGLSGPITAAHFHRAETGSNGGPVRTITSDFSGNQATGLWTDSDAEPLTDELIQALMVGDLYVNVHTGDYGAGEIRGQVEPGGGFGSAVHLNPTQETHEVTSAATGTSTVLLTEFGAVFHATAEGLSGPITAAHFHNGAFGMNGGPVRTITSDFTGNTAAGFWSIRDPESLTTTLAKALLAGDVYLNVHTASYGAGEIRGQINPDGAVITAIETDGGVAPSTFKLAQNYPNPFNPETRIRFELAEQGRVQLTVFNLIGQRVSQLVNQALAPGTHEVLFDARSLPSGVYLYQLDVDGRREQKQMVLLK